MKALFGALLALIALTMPSFAHEADQCPGLLNGFWSLGNIGMFLSAVIMAVAGLALYLYLELPALLLKWFLLGIGIACVYFGHAEPLGWPAGLWAFFGALGIGGFVVWFMMEQGSDESSVPLRLAAGVLSVVWGYLAVSDSESVVGFMAVVALGYVIASTETVDMLATPFGVGEVVYSGSTTCAGFVILGLYLIGLRYGFAVAPFEFGALYVSGLLLSTSLLINTWAELSKTWLSYLFHELLFLGFAVGSVVFGAELGAPDFVEIGGTFLIGWVLLKVVQFITKVFVHSPLLGIVALLAVGVSGVMFSTSLMQYSELLRAYTIL